jgi:hypothetical protein
MRLFYLDILILVICFFACNNSSDFEVVGPVYGPIYNAASQNYGTITAEKNGVLFVGNTSYLNHYNYCNGCYSFNMYTYEDSVHLVEFLNVSNLNLTKLGLYDLFPDDPLNNTLGLGIGLDKNTEVSYSTRLEIGDVEGDTYELYEYNDNEAFPNWLEIQSVDTLSKTIKGKFQLHFRKIIENDIRNPKYVKFSNVEFELKMD